MEAVAGRELLPNPVSGRPRCAAPRTLRLATALLSNSTKSSPKGAISILFSPLFFGKSRDRGAP
jgi:hypothetical protein